MLLKKSLFSYIIFIINILYITNNIFNFVIMIGVWWSPPPPPHPTAIFLFFGYASTTELSPPVTKLLFSLETNNCEKR